MSYHSGYNSEAEDTNLSGSGNMFYFGQVSSAWGLAEIPEFSIGNLDGKLFLI